MKKLLSIIALSTVFAAPAFAQSNTSSITGQTQTGTSTQTDRLDQIGTTANKGSITNYGNTSAKQNTNPNANINSQGTLKANDNMESTTSGSSGITGQTKHDMNHNLKDKKDMKSTNKYNSQTKKDLLDDNNMTDGRNNTR